MRFLSATMRLRIPALFGLSQNRTANFLSAKSKRMQDGMSLWAEAPFEGVSRTWYGEPRKRG